MKKTYFSMLVLTFFLILSSMSGCGPGQRDRAVVKGKVTFGNDPVPMANVTFTTKDNRVASAVTDENGNYTINDAPVGEVAISVTVPQLSGSAKMGGGIKMPEPPKDMSGLATNKLNFDPQKLPRVPEKYEKPETSGLTYKVHKGENTYDIPLNP
jgi:hypothetical protein